MCYCDKATSDTGSAVALEDPSDHRNRRRPDCLVEIRQRDDFYLALMVPGVTKAWSMVLLPPRLRSLIIACVLGTAGVTTCFIGANFSEITTMMGKDSHLTGRSDLWSNALLAIADRPLLGYGFQAFTQGVDSGPARTVELQAAGWEDATRHAHNGYIDLTLSIGLVGLMTYLTSVASGFRRATQYLLAGEDSYPEDGPFPGWHYCPPTRYRKPQS